MVDHGQKIGFEPTNFKLDDDDEETDVSLNERYNFSTTIKKAPLSQQETEKFSGVILKNIPVAMPDKEIELTIKRAGNAENHPFRVTRIGDRATVEVNDLDNKKCI